MSTQEILEAHLSWHFPDGESDETRCRCGHVIAVGNGAQKMDMAQGASIAHVAEVLEQHMQEREAGALESFVASQMQMLENMEYFADEHDRDEVDRWCSVISNRAKEIREATNGR